MSIGENKDMVIENCGGRDVVEVRDSLNGIFGSWARWTRAPPDVQSSWETAAAVAAITVAVAVAVAAAVTWDQI